jgi:rare lipoprotein A (peptidoglycan hydrolase)
MKFIAFAVFLLTSAKVFAAPPDSTAIYDTVVKGETLAGISKRFNITEAQLRKWNNLKGMYLKPAQVLIVGYKRKPEPVAPVVPKKDSVVNKPAAYDSSSYYNNYKGKEIIEGGLGAWSDSLNMGNEKYYALHNKAPVGTIIKVINVQTQKVVYVKVVGPITGNYPANNQIIVSRAASQKLGVDDENFVCKLSYTRE